MLKTIEQEMSPHCDMPWCAYLAYTNWQAFCFDLLLSLDEVEDDLEYSELSSLATLCVVDSLSLGRASMFEGESC